MSKRADIVKGQRTSNEESFVKAILAIIFTTSGFSVISSANFVPTSAFTSCMGTTQ